MKAISLTQPWASLVAIGAKRIETRSWRPTSALGEDIAIHAAKSFPVDCRQLCDQTIFARTLNRSWMQLPLGAVIAVARLESYAPTEELVSDGSLTMIEEAFGDYSACRFGWRLSNVRSLATPIACRGSLGIWFLPEQVEREVQLQLSMVSK